MFGKRKPVGRPVEGEQESDPERHVPPGERAPATGGGLTLRLVLAPKDPPPSREES